jgi:hypothetical protein
MWARRPRPRLCESHQAKNRRRHGYDDEWFHVPPQLGLGNLKPENPKNVLGPPPRRSTIEVVPAICARSPFLEAGQGQPPAFDNSSPSRTTACVRRDATASTQPLVGREGFAVASAAASRAAAMDRAKGPPVHAYFCFRGARACRPRDDTCLFEYGFKPNDISFLDHERTLFTFSDVTSTNEELKTRLDRIRILVHRLSRVRDSALEAEIITELTLETEAVDRARAAALGSNPAKSASAINPPVSDSARSLPARDARGADPTEQPARTAPPNRAPGVRRVGGVRTRVRTVRRVARRG